MGKYRKRAAANIKYTDKSTSYSCEVKVEVLGGFPTDRSVPGFSGSSRLIDGDQVDVF